jgi:hypothetical protein
MGYESPIWDSIEGTHANFNKCLEAVLDQVGAVEWGCRQCSLKWSF